MNTVRTIGFILLVIGIIIKYILYYESLDFLSGMVMGIGIALILIGKIRNPKI
jgi:hypothetical protein